MKINELKAEDTITITILMQGQKIEFKSKIVNVSMSEIDPCIELNPIRVDGKIITFNNLGIIKASYSNEVDGRLYEWNNCNMNSVRVNDKLIYRVHNVLDIKPTNRRAFVRVYVGESGEVQLLAEKVSYEIIVKDISLLGISFIMKDMFDIPLQSHIMVSFVDNDLRRSFHLKGKVVRTFVTEGNKLLIGCKFDNMMDRDKWLVKLINNKELIELQKNKKAKGLT